MKHFFTITLCLLSAIALPCHGQTAMSNIARYELRGFELFWIGDNAKERNTDMSLFHGITEDIVKELGLGDGAPSSMSIFLIKTDGQNLLFDTGMGSAGSLLIPSLASHGIAPEDVDAIFITHLHGDHTGGLAKEPLSISIGWNTRVWEEKRSLNRTEAGRSCSILATN